MDVGTLDGLVVTRTMVAQQMRRIGVVPQVVGVRMVLPLFTGDVRRWALLALGKYVWTSNEWRIA